MRSTHARAMTMLKVLGAGILLMSLVACSTGKANLIGKQTIPPKYPALEMEIYVDPATMEAVYIFNANDMEQFYKFFRADCLRCHDFEPDSEFPPVPPTHSQ